MDIQLNSDFDIEFDDRNDLPLTSGSRSNEQRIAIQLTAFFHDEIGSLDHPQAIKLLELQADRIVDETSGVETLVQIQFDFDDVQPGVLNVTIIYESSTSTFQITE